MDDNHDDIFVPRDLKALKTLLEEYPLNDVLEDVYQSGGDQVGFYLSQHASYALFQSIGYVTPESMASFIKLKVSQYTCSKLIDDDYLELASITDDGDLSYTLTQNGREYASTIDPNSIAASFPSAKDKFLLAFVEAERRAKENELENDQSDDSPEGDSDNEFGLDYGGF